VLPSRAADKPGCTTAEQLADLRRAVAETGRIGSVNYSERFEVHAVTRALDLVNASWQPAGMEPNSAARREADCALPDGIG
jgi:predicted dehydrogenase